MIRRDLLEKRYRTATYLYLIANSARLHRFSTVMPCRANPAILVRKMFIKNTGYFLFVGEAIMYSGIAQYSSLYRQNQTETKTAPVRCYVLCARQTTESKSMFVVAIVLQHWDSTAFVVCKVKILKRLFCDNYSNR